MMKHPKIYSLLLLFLTVLFAAGSTVVHAKNDNQKLKIPPNPPKNCEPYTGTNFPIPGLSLTYSQAGHELIRHYFSGMIDDDTIMVVSYVPEVKNNRIFKYQSFTQEININTRLVEKTTGDIIPYTNPPGDVPAGQYTDLWIPVTVNVGDEINLYATTTVVGQDSMSTWYVGDSTPFTTFGAMAYSKTTGVFLGFETPTPSARLTDIMICR